jgi:DNA-binding Lrp family transcriptional regulator
MTVTVTQRLLDRVSQALADIPEVVEVFGLSGATDLLVRVVARDADDLYRIAGNVLATRGVERTETALAMRRLVTYRVTGLLQRLVEGPS